jgi:hypothetical protein
MSGPLSRAGGDVEPFRQLWAMVLTLAVDDLAGISTDRTGECRGGERASNARRARAWFMSDRIGPGSFSWICHTLDLDPERTRKVILQRIASPNRRLAA